MSAYLTKSQEEKLRETYKLYGCKRFHSMNAATRTVKDCCTYNDIDNVTGEKLVKLSDAIHFYSYYTECVVWYPKANILWVNPIVAEGYDLTPTTTQQVNRFLRECVRPNVDVSALQYGYTINEWHKSYYVDSLRVNYSSENSYLSRA